MQLTSRWLIGVLVINIVSAQEEAVTVSDESVEEASSTTQLPPRAFTFRPEVLKKFRIVLKRIFNFDQLFNGLSNRTPQFTRLTTSAQNGERKTTFQLIPDSSARTVEREMLEETAEVPERPVDDYEQRRREYERYWRQYYAQQQNQNGWYDNRLQQQQQQLYSPYQPQQNYNPYNYNYYNQVQQSSPYGPRVFQQTPYYGQQQPLSMQAGTNFGSPGMFLTSGLGLNFG
ncbi:hypothetical protein M3Y94_01145600 [Aphelenchoides besseyi]|nr:hypothetical protein M3Y94_01145600 [Aphelenchoides besseyi]